MKRMKYKVPKSVAATEIDRSGAPQVAGPCAWKKATKFANWRSRCGLSGRKHRFMALVLGKMTPAALAKNDVSNDVSNDVDTAPSDLAAWPKMADDGGDPHLHETMPQASKNRASHGSNESPTMSFTYPPGSKPLPPYTIRRGVGVGGFGEVYFAVSEAGKEVALKRIQRNLEVELRGVSHCLNLKHTNLVSLYDICHDSASQAWVVMEYIAGPNLRQVLDLSPQGLSECEVRRWFTGIAAGVQHLHSAGLVHRDLKPGNVFDDLGCVKVGDYGLSKFISASHRGGHTESVGTFHYMAPEIGRGQYGREIDVYALGIMLYELLTGQVPFDGESCHEIIVKHLTAAPDLSKIADPYRSVIARSLAKDPAKRPSSVDEMLAPLGWADTASTVQAVVVEEPIQVIAAEPIHDAMLVEPVTRVDHIASENHVPSNQRAEPLAQAVRENALELHRWWNTMDRSPRFKGILLAAIIVVIAINTSWLLPMLMSLAFIYVPYYVIRQMVLHVREQPSYAQAQRSAMASGVSAVQQTDPLRWRGEVRNKLRAKHPIERMAELSTSWIAASLTVTAMTIIAAVVGLRVGDVTPADFAPYGWMATIILLGSLSILAMGKLWEREDGEALPRRLVMAGIGAGVGVAAYGLSEYLMLPMDVGLDRNVDSTTLPQALYTDNQMPRPSALMAHFAVLFAVLRWWKPVDPLRPARLSLWNVAVTVVAAWGVHQILPIPQPCGMLIAGGTAIAVQMSAPWVDPRNRRSRSMPSDAVDPTSTPLQRRSNQESIA